MKAELIVAFSNPEEEDSGISHEGMERVEKYLDGFMKGREFAKRNIHWFHGEVGSSRLSTVCILDTVHLTTDDGTDFSQVEELLNEVSSVGRDFWHSSIEGS